MFVCVDVFLCISVSASEYVWVLLHVRVFVVVCVSPSLWRACMEGFEKKFYLKFFFNFILI